MQRSEPDRAAAAAGIVPFLIELGGDPERAEQLGDDPDGILASSGLTPSARAIANCRDPRMVRTALVRVARDEPPPGGDLRVAPITEPVPARRAPTTGTLVIVGTGIKLVAHASGEACAHIRRADKVYYLVPEPAAAAWVLGLNYRAESLHGYLTEGQPRHEAYDLMIERILGTVRRGLRVCAVFYGHPGVFVDPAHRALRRARAEGITASMLPGISAADCLFADLGLDPGRDGCQMLEATEFLVTGRSPDRACALLLFQVGMIGRLDHAKNEAPGKGLRVLVDVLSADYEQAHEVVLYEATHYPSCDPVIARLPLGDLPDAPVTAFSTLLVPPAVTPAADPRMLERLGMKAPRRR